jgi:ribonuclease G
MAKEMIVSVNGREKKIAIVEDGKVTEFYIERGEENSGVVGNIYKGRVQRVLPGMQSAFVEIGLERDAFLYVSDFFDEEEEFERIVMEKAKKSDVSTAEKAASERLQQARLEREHTMETVQELVEPLLQEPVLLDPTLIGEFPAEDFEPEAEETAEQWIETEKPASQSRTEKRRGKKDHKAKAEKVEKLPEILLETEEEEFIEEIETPFSHEDSSFERIIDEDEAVDTSELFREARIQERLTDQVRAIEFEIEPTVTNFEVGSLLKSADNDAFNFERISDDAETAIGTAQVAETVPAESKSSKRSRNRRGGGRKAAPEIKEEAVTEQIPEAQPIETVESEEQTAKPEKSSRSGKKSPPKRPTAKKETAETAPKSTSKKKSNKKPKVAQTKVEGSYQDAEASVETPADIAEFAVRRGGRRRRRRPSGNGDERFDSPENAEATTELAYEEPEVAPKERESRSGQRRNGRDGNGSRRHQPPTITDLLREGQEVLVQIAKEPISKKGARITSHIALPGRYLVYMPTIEHVGVSRKIESSNERGRLRNLIQKIRNEEDVPSGGFIVRTAGIGIPEQNLREDARYLIRTWLDIRKTAEKSKAPALVHQDLDLVERLLRDQLNDEFAAIRVDSEEEYLRVVEFVNRIQPRMVNRVKLYTRDEPILEAFGVQDEIDKAIKPRVWLKSGGYLVINQTEALVAIDVNTGKFVGGKGGTRLEDTITKTNMEAVQEIARQIRLRDLGGIIVLDLIDMEDKRNRQKVLQTLQEALEGDKSPTKVLSYNDFGLIIMTRKRVKQSLERTICSPCHYCQGAGLIKSAQTVCYEILEEARRLSRGMDDYKQVTLRVNPEIAKALRSTEKEVLIEIEDYLGAVDLTSDATVHQEQFDFAFI